LLIADGAAERALIDVVIHLAAGPVDGLAEGSGIEEADAGYILGSAGEGDAGSESENCSE
jgi:hypothetical protein